MRLAAVVALLAALVARPAGADERYRLIVNGAGPGGLSAALSAIREGVNPRDILVIEERTLDGRRGRHPYGSRTRVAVLDEDGLGILERNGVRAPGASLTMMSVRMPDGHFRWFPNSGAWRTGVSAAFGDRQLERLTTIGEIERNQLAEFQRLGGKVLFGAPGALELDRAGNGRIRVGSKRYAADLVVLAEGAHSPNVAAHLERTAVAEDSTSYLLSLDFAVPHGSRIRPGDLFSVLDPDSRTLIYGFVAGRYASVSMLLPKGADVERQLHLRQRYLAALRRAAQERGLDGPPLDPDGAVYSGRLTMAERTMIGKNVIPIGDALRTVDAISGLGANTALADGEAIGRYFTTFRRAGLGAALHELRDTLRANTRKCFEISLLFREMADFAYQNPKLSFSTYRLGLSSRGGGSLMDLGKHATAAWVKAVVGRRTHVGLIQGNLRLAGGPAPAFKSSERSLRIGRVHPGDGRKTSRR